MPREDPTTLARTAQRATFHLAKVLEGDVEVEPRSMVENLLGIAVGLATAVEEVADALQAAGRRDVAKALRGAQRRQNEAVSALVSASVKLGA